MPLLRHNLGKHPGIAVERHPCGSNFVNGPAGISWKILGISRVGTLFLYHTSVDVGFFHIRIDYFVLPVRSLDWLGFFAASQPQMAQPFRCYFSGLWIVMTQ